MTSKHEPTDEELLEQWRAGDKQAGEALLRRHFVGLRSFALGRVDDEELAREIVQETMLVIVGDPAQFRAESSFKSYLFGIARNKCREHLRKRSGDRQRFDPSTDSIADVTGRRYSSILTEKDNLRRLFDALRSLPMDVQDLLDLFYFQDLRVREIADLDGTNANTIKSRLRLARQQLGRCVQESAGQPVDRELSEEQIHEWMLDARAPARRGERRDPQE